MRGEYYLEHVRNLLEATLEVLATLHKILDVVDVGEVDLERLEELRLALGKVAVGQHGQQVAEVVARVEGEPLDVVQEDDTGHDEHLREVDGLDALPLVPGGPIRS